MASNPKSRLQRPALSYFRVEDRFYPGAQKLRSYFTRQFDDEQSLDSKRFVWDYWNVPDQYRLIRTPAYHYFPEKTYMEFHRHLIDWGRKNLGCWDISPPWLSYYIDGCEQHLHSDVPHGPWAFVFSLTDWQNRRFQGGETLILRPETLSYWQNFGASKNRELHSFVQTISSDFNRLVVFDPRYPHGVRRVHGEYDPRGARVVIHGWFTEPKTYIDGFVSKARAEKLLNSAFDRIAESVELTPPIQGTVSLRFRILPSGKTQQVRFMTNTLLTLDGKIPEELNRLILSSYRKLNFGKSRGPTDVTVPLIFQ